MLNNPSLLFKCLSDGSNQVNFYEAYIVMVLFCKYAEYEDRLRLVFDSFDVNGGGTLDRKELNVFVQCSLYGLCKIVGINVPSKLTISRFIGDNYRLVDSDGSG